jgi:hypothetical protein
LKLFVLLPDGGQEVSTVPALESSRYFLPCENDQAKPDHISRLARSTNCQRSLRVVRLSGSLRIEASTFIKVSSNLLRYTNLALSSSFRCRLRDFLRISNFVLFVNPCLFSRPGPSGLCRRLVPRVAIQTG